MMRPVAHVILGLLLLRPMSQYDLIRAFEAGVSLFYSASSGSIKRALDGLRERGYVAVEEAGGRGRKVHRVTPAGRTAFHDWMTGEVVGGGTETAVLSRLFFLGLLEPAERRSVLARMEEAIAADLVKLEAVASAIEHEDVPEELAEVAAYQRMTLDYGLASNAFALQWFRDRMKGVR